MQWFLYGYSATGHRTLLLQGAMRDDVYGAMMSTSYGEALTALAVVSVELKQEWGGHVSSGR